MRALPIIAFAAALTTPALAISAADNLGSVLGAADGCGLTYDEAAVLKWIDENVDEKDMGFMDSLRYYTQNSEEDTAELSGIALAAHCHQTKRTARANGFLVE